MTIPILFLAADPTDASRLRLGEEIREIQYRLQLAQLRDHFVLHQRHAVRIPDLTQALLDVSPEIVHFSGHGTQAGAICLEDNAGRIQEVGAPTLAALFKHFSSIRCVVLNACFSANQSSAIAQSVPYVVGMTDAIGDHAAIAFSVGFYQALGAGRNIPDSFGIGQAHVQMAAGGISPLPVLILKNPRSPSLEQKTYDFPGGIGVTTFRKGRSFTSDPVDRQRVGLATLGLGAAWRCIAVIESLGPAEHAVQVTSSAGQMIRVLLEESARAGLTLDRFDPAFLVEMTVRYANLGARHYLNKHGLEDVCGAKLALGWILQDSIHVATVGDTGGVARWTSGELTFYRNISTASQFTVRGSPVALRAPVGHILAHDELPADFADAWSVAESGAQLGCVEIPLATDADFVVLTSHRLQRSDANTDALLARVSTITTARGVAEYLCAVEGADYEECLGVAVYRSLNRTQTFGTEQHP